MGTLEFNDKNQLTNEITLKDDPKTPLAMGMTVTATGVPSGTTILKVVGKSIYLSQMPDDDTPMTQDYALGRPKSIKYDLPGTNPVTLTFDEAATPYAQKFAAAVYEAMAAEAPVVEKTALPFAMQLVDNITGFYVFIPSYNKPTGADLQGQVRDIVKSILRGVPDFNDPAYSNQMLWYPDPSMRPKGLTGDQNFNVFNPDPYVWFVHKVEGMSGYGFSVDDDVSNPSAGGPLLAADGQPNHSPSNLQMGFGGTGGLTNQTEWFPTIPWAP
jgi:hypothetical protein